MRRRASVKSDEMQSSSTSQKFQPCFSGKSHSQMEVSWLVVQVPHATNRRDQSSPNVCLQATGLLTGEHLSREVPMGVSKRCCKLLPGW